MKEQKIFEAIGEIDDKFIEQAQKHVFKAAPIMFPKKTIALVACAVLIFTAAIWRPSPPEFLEESVDQAAPESNETDGGFGMEDATTSEPAPEPTPQEPQAPSDPTAGGDLDKEAGTDDALAGGVYLPKLDLPENSDPDVESDMIGLVVYGGSIYTEGQFMRLSDSEIEAMMGEQVGTAIGNIDEWSSQEQYAVELAASIYGDIYTVNGYDSNFRLAAVMSEYDGKTDVLMLEKLNDIELVTGEDLYGDKRLNLGGDVAQVTYQTHEQWYNSTGEFNKLEGFDEQEIDALIENLMTAPFVEDNEFDRNSVARARLYFDMADGTQIALEVFENGYVRYANMHGDFYTVLEHDEIFEQLSERIF